METQHFTRPCGVLIKKPKLRILDEYTAFKGFILTNTGVVSYDDWIAYKEKLVKIERDRLKSAIGKVLLEPVIDPDNFYLVENNTFTGDNSVPVNNRVIAISVNQSVNTAWTASITLDNTDDKYYLKDTITADKRIYFQEKECVIESNDMIQIFLPDWNDQLNSVFTGFVNKVAVTDDGEVKRITLQCEDITKLMAVTRTNQNPSLDVMEAEGSKIAVTNPAYADKPVSEILKYVFGRTFLNIFRDPDLITDLKTTLDNLKQKATTDTVAQQRAFALTQYNVLVDKAIDRYVDEFWDVKTGKLTGYIGHKVEAILTDPSVANPTLDLFGINSPLFTNIPKAIVGPSTALYKFGSGRIAFEINSLDQPVYALQFGSGAYSFINSEWISNDVLIKQIADKCFFEFYADAIGIVHFKPKELVLPQVNKTTTQEDQDFITENYWILDSVNSPKRGYKPRSFFVKKWITDFNDRAICTGILVHGQYLYNEAPETLAKVVNSPLKFRRKFGIRMLAQETRLGLLTIEAIAAYAQQRLWRQNSQAYAAGIEFIGNSMLRCGNPIYIERWSSVYYIEEVSHSYTAMTDYSTEVVLSYRRKPIALLGASYSSLENQLVRMVSENDLSQEEANYILKEKGSLTWGKFKTTIPVALGTAVIQGNVVASALGTTATVTSDIVWEGIPTILNHGDITVREEELKNAINKQAKSDKATLDAVSKTISSAIHNTVRSQVVSISAARLDKEKLGSSGLYSANDWNAKVPTKSKVLVASNINDTIIK